MSKPNQEPPNSKERRPRSRGPRLVCPDCCSADLLELASGHRHFDVTYYASVSSRYPSPEGYVLRGTSFESALGRRRGAFGPVSSCVRALPSGEAPVAQWIEQRFPKPQPNGHSRLCDGGTATSAMRNTRARSWRTAARARGCTVQNGSAACAPP